jgi:hypothetical protein
VLIEHETTILAERTAAALAAAASALAPRPLRLVHSPAAQFAAALSSYSVRGGVLASVARGELMRARLPTALATAGFAPTHWARAPLEPLTNSTRTAASAAWQALLSALGMRPADATALSSAYDTLRAGLLRAGHGASHGAQGAAPAWTGCYRDRAEEREMSDGPRTFGHTSLACAVACTGYPAFALQNGGQCFCGAPPANASRRTPAQQCGRVCAGEEGKLPARLCGGGWRNAVYANPATLLADERRGQGTPPPPPPKQAKGAPKAKGGADARGKPTKSRNSTAHVRGHSAGHSAGHAASHPAGHAVGHASVAAGGKRERGAGGSAREHHHARHKQARARHKSSGRSARPAASRTTSSKRKGAK